MIRLRNAFLIVSIVLIYAVASAHSSFDSKCNTTIAELARDDPRRYFDRDSLGNIVPPGDNRLRMYLDQCVKTCGPIFSRYDNTDIIRRIALWMIPIFVLVGNFQFPPLGGLHSMCVAIHLFGDPIDSVYSLLVKLEVSRKISSLWANFPPELREGETYESQEERKRSFRDIGTVNVLYDEWGYVAPSVYGDMRRTFNRLDGQGRMKFIAACKEAAHRLSDSRVDDSLRAWLAVGGYLIGVAGAFLKTLESGVSNRTAHTIAFAVLYSWLVPAVVMSASIGGFSSMRVGRRVIREIKDELQDDWPVPDPTDRNYVSSIRLPFMKKPIHKDSASLEESFGFLGCYSFRHNKNLNRPRPSGLETRHGHSWNRPNWLLQLLSFLPVLISTCGAVSLSSMLPPFGLGCRSLTHITFCASWILSALLTKISSHFLAGKYHFRLTIAKDLLLAATQTSFTLAAFIGFFNSCKCWSNYYSLTRRTPAWVEVVDIGILNDNVRRKWPIITAIALALQGLMLLILYLNGARGLEIFRRTEEEQKRVFGEILGHEKIITRKLSIPESWDSDHESARASRKGSGYTANDSKLFFAPVLVKLGTLGQ